MLDFDFENDDARHRGRPVPMPRLDLGPPTGIGRRIVIPKPMPLPDPFRFIGSVGPDGDNFRDDVIRARCCWGTAATTTLPRWARRPAGPAANSGAAFANIKSAKASLQTVSCCHWARRAWARMVSARQCLLCKMTWVSPSPADACRRPVRSTGITTKASGVARRGRRCPGVGDRRARRRWRAVAISAGHRVERR